MNMSNSPICNPKYTFFISFEYLFLPLFARYEFYANLQLQIDFNKHQLFVFYLDN